MKRIKWMALMLQKVWILFKLKKKEKDMRIMKWKRFKTLKLKTLTILQISI
jgi:hypothetical protein